VTICSDTPAQVKRGRKKHGAKAVMLADPDLTVTERYGLRQERMIAPKPGVIAALPIPATFLVDAAGIVRWIDRSSDYQVRSSPDRVLAAIEANLPAPAA